MNIEDEELEHNLRNSHRSNHIVELYSEHGIKCRCRRGP